MNLSFTKFVKQIKHPQINLVHWWGIFQGETKRNLAVYPWRSIKRDGDEDVVSETQYNKGLFQYFDLFAE